MKLDHLEMILFKMSDLILQLITESIHLILSVCIVTVEETGLDRMVTMLV
jgi:hypothetical protein